MVCGRKLKVVQAKVAVTTAGLIRVDHLGKLQLFLAITFIAL
jgi:hypothetical protein